MAKEAKKGVMLDQIGTTDAMGAALRLQNKNRNKKAEPVSIEEFKNLGYISPKEYNRPEELLRIKKEIEASIGSRPGFGGISFSDVAAYGIQVHVNHKRAELMEGGWHVTLRYQAVGHKRKFTDDFLTGWGCQSYDADGAIKALIEWWNTKGEEISKRSPCDHDFKVIRSKMCFTEYKCTKCGHESFIDSSD